MIDVERDDRAACGDFAADKFRGDFPGDALGKLAEDGGGVVGLFLSAADVLFVEVVADDVLGIIGQAGRLCSCFEVFADGDEFHLRGDDALAGVVELGHRRVASAPEGLAAGGGEAGEFDELVGALGVGGELGMLLGEVAVILRLDLAPVVGFDVIAVENPLAAQSGKAFF